MNDSSIVLLAQGLTKSYGRVQALRGVELEVQRGEVFGFLGPNGAGKTTTIRILLDLIRPDGGTVRVLGLDPQKDALEVRARCGYLPGELHLEDAETVETILKQFNTLRGGKADWTYIRNLADRLGLDLKTQTKNLSKGNKQKVGVVQALMHRPELLLLDEPTSGLDPLIQQEVHKLIGEAKADGATIFFSSHVIGEVEQLADRVGIIRKGMVVEVAETQALIKRALRRARVRFGGEIQVPTLEDIPGVSILSRSADSVTLRVEGEMDALIKELAKFPVIEFETERPSLEEIFLAYYER